MNRILVVDDEIEYCRTLKDFMVKKNYEVDIALNGVEAVKKVEKMRPHIVFLDIIMSGMSGIEVLIKIKEIDSNIKIIILTALSDRELKKNALEFGADEYILKPIDIKYIESIIQSEHLKQKSSL